jgi:GT2 family glycosyltransferase/glycosyltransferase involved in cell wall biosynthesis
MFFLLRRFILIAATLAVTPVLWVLGAALLLVNLIRRIARLIRRPATGPNESVSGLASIVILNWNGKDLLAQGLPSVLKAVEADGRPHEIIVVDNGSTDGSVEFVARKFGSVRVVALPHNAGFGAGNNAGVRAAAHEVVVLLNNDMAVDSGFLRPLLDGFRENTFAVSSQIFHQDASARREETGKTSACFRRGLIEYAHLPVEPGTAVRPYYPAFWAGGGSSAFHRDRFLELGGFQEIFAPAYVEDTDLSFRAWKAGWEVRFAPASIVYHKHRASSSRRFSRAALDRLIQKNQFLFFWKNIDSIPALLSHCAWLPIHCYRLTCTNGFGIWAALFRAAAKIPNLAVSAGMQPGPLVRKDSEVFRLFSAPGLFFAQERAKASNAPVFPEGHRPRILWMTAYLPHLGHHAGAGRMYHLLKRLAGDYRITLLSFIEFEQERAFIPELESFCERVVAMPRIPPPRWQMFAYEPFDEFRTPEMLEALAESLEAYDYDLIQLEYTQMACYGDKRLRIPTLVTKHEVDFAACARRAKLEPTARRKLRWFYNYLQVLDREVKLMRQVDGAICMTDTDARELRRFLPAAPVHIISTGVDLDHFSVPDQSSREPVLVFVGAFRHDPNVDAMLYFCREILPRIQAEIPETKLLIVGSSPPPVISGLAKLPGVEVTGFVPDIRPFMSAASVYVVPLRLGVGIRGKILEAWGMGMAVVATSVAAAGLRCTDGTNLLLADDPGLFASRVLSLMRDRGKRESLGQQGRATAEQFYGWDAAARQLDTLYQSCRKNRGAAGSVYHHAEPQEAVHP